MSTLILSIGGLGNQLFQLAAGLHFSETKNLILDYSVHSKGIEGSKDLSEFVLPRRLQIMHSFKFSLFQKRIINLCIRLSSLVSDNAITKNLGRRLISILQSFLGLIYPGKWTVNHGIGLDANYDFARTNFHIGYFQTYRYFDNPDVRKTMRRLTLRDPSEAFKKNRAELANLDSLVVHVRLGDYRSETKFGMPSMTYFHNSILGLWSENTFSRISLFSNELDEATEYIPNYLREYLWTPNENLITTSETLELMRCGSAYVLSNSSFSWWAAALSHVEAPSVIYPLPWFQKISDPIELIPKDWIGKPSTS